jgi:hypothetical protein
MKNVILVHDITRDFYYVGLLSVTLESGPRCLIDRVSVLDERLWGGWGYEQESLYPHYRYRNTEQNLEDSICIAQYVALLFPDTSDKEINTQNYELINF